MRFAIEDVFPGTLARLEALLDDPDFYPRMQRELPGLARIELLARDEVDGVVRRRVRYTPRGATIPSFGRGVVSDEMLIWVEESHHDRAAHRIDYRVEPNLPARWRDRFDSHGRFSFAAVPGGVARRIEGEVVVRVPIFGALAERILVDELRRGFRAEAQVLGAWLRERSDGEIFF